VLPCVELLGLLEFIGLLGFIGLLELLGLIGSIDFVAFTFCREQAVRSEGDFCA
jgi:hypothetical protein